MQGSQTRKSGQSAFSEASQGELRGSTRLESLLSVDTKKASPHGLSTISSKVCFAVPCRKHVHNECRFEMPNAEFRVYRAAAQPRFSEQATGLADPTPDLWATEATSHDYKAEAHDLLPTTSYQLATYHRYGFE